MKSEWKVQCNYINGKTMYIPYRVLDTSKTVHSGNMEHYGGYVDSHREAEKMAAWLNEREETDE